MVLNSGIVNIAVMIRADLHITISCPMLSCTILLPKIINYLLQPWCSRLRESFQML